MGSLLKVVFKNIDVLAGPFVTLVYPLYASVRAIETQSHIDDRQWLTYWVLYSLITLFEMTFAKLIGWLPFWSYAKLLATCWLVLPYFSGAAYVYENFVRPIFMNTQTVNIWPVPQKKETSSRSDDVPHAAEKSIQETGLDATENFIEKTDKHVSKSKINAGSRQTIFDALPFERDSKAMDSYYSIFGDDHRH